MKLEIIPRPAKVSFQKGRLTLGAAPALKLQMGKHHRDLGEEGYRLSVREDGILIQAFTQAGLRYGLNTLAQLQQGKTWLPVLTLEDRPKFAWRGVLIDSCRHFHSVPFLKKVIEELAFFKFNRMHWHLTEDNAWRIEIKKYPRLTQKFAPGGHYTQAQVRELVAFAEARGVTIVPEIEMPGHATAALAAYPGLSCAGKPIPLPSLFGLKRHVFCAGREEVFRFQKNVLKEVAGLFPSKELHIGCDEVKKDNWKACPRCQARMEKLGLKDEKALQTYFAARCLKILKGLGKTAVAWDEINEGGAPKGVIVQCWHIGEKPNLVAQAARAGLKAIASPTEYCYLDYSNWSLDLKKASQFEPVPRGLNAAQKKLVLGGECALWTEFIPQDQAFKRLFPRALATAEVLWSGKPEFKEFERRVKVQVKALAKRGVKSGPAGTSRADKAIPWEPAYYKKGFPKSLKHPKPKGW